MSVWVTPVAVSGVHQVAERVMPLHRPAAADIVIDAHFSWAFIVLHCPHDLPHSALLSPRFMGQHQYRVSAPDAFVSQNWCGTTSFRLEDDAYVHSLDLAHLQQSETQLPPTWGASDMALPVEPSCVLGVVVMNVVYSLVLMQEFS